MPKVALNPIGSRYGSIDALNDNFDIIEQAFENTLSRDGAGPNSLEANVDANSYRIINLPTPIANDEVATKGYVDVATATINSYLGDIETVADNINAVITVADVSQTLVDNLSDIVDVGNNINNVNAVAGNIGSVELVGLDLNGQFQSGVIYDFGLITDNPVGPAPVTDSSIVIVADDITSVTTVATNIANVNTVATNIASVNTAATNIVAIQNASTNATNAATSAATAVTAKDSAIVAQLAAESALASTLTAYDNFDDRYLGAKANDPSTDNDGNALVGGTLYFQTGAGMKIWTGSSWEFAYVPGSTYLAKINNLSDLTNTTTARTNLGLGSLATLSTVGTTELTNNAVTVDKLATTLDYGSIV